MSTAADHQLSTLVLRLTAIENDVARVDSADAATIILAKVRLWCVDCLNYTEDHLRDDDAPRLEMMSRLRDRHADVRRALDVACLRYWRPTTPGH